MKKQDLLYMEPEIHGVSLTGPGFDPHPVNSSSAIERQTGLWAEPLRPGQLSFSLLPSYES